LQACENLLGEFNRLRHEYEAQQAQKEGAPALPAE
jgi:hypothetical protein